jgi:hypothetical protein
MSASVRSASSAGPSTRKTRAAEIGRQAGGSLISALDDLLNRKVPADQRKYASSSRRLAF